MNAAEMPAQSEISPPLWRRPFLRWMDGIEAGWGVPVLLFAFVVVSLAFLTIAYFNGDLDADTLKAWSSGRSLQWGYFNYPPLAAWLAHAWAWIFPLTNWSFRLLAVINAALALWAVDLISRRFVGGDRRMVVLLLLMLLPIYQFQAQQFDAGAVLLAAWPVATYCFLRSFETRQIGWAIAAGATAALAMLGKYHSVFLIASFVAAAIVHPRRRAYLLSPAPWLSAVAGLAVLGPHLYWVETAGANSFADALGRLAAATTAASLIEGLLVTLILVLLVAIPVAIWGLMEPGRLRKLSQVFRIIEPGQLLLFLVSVGTIVFPAITAVALGTDITQAWEFQGLFLLVILVVCGSSSPIERSRSVNLATFATAVAVLALLVAAPLHALYRNYHPLDQGRNFYQMSADELTRQWHERSAGPLPLVGGDEVLALAAAFYSPDHPMVEEGLLQRDAETTSPGTTFEQGWASLCFDTDALCIDAMERAAAGASGPAKSGTAKSEFAVDSNLLGLPGVQQRFTVLIVPPSANVPSPAAPSVSGAPSAALPPAVAEAPSAAAPPSTAEAPSASTPPAVAEAPSAAAPPSTAEAPSAAPPAAVAEAPSAAAPPSTAEAPAAAPPPAVAEAPSAAAPPSTAEVPSATPPPAVAEVPSTAVPPAVAEVPSTATPPSAASSPSAAEPSSVATAPPAATTSPAPPAASVAEGSAAALAAGGQQGASSPAGSNESGTIIRQSEIASAPALFPKEVENTPDRRAAPPLVYKAPRMTADWAAAEYKVNWARWAAARRAAAGCPIGPAQSGWRNPCCSSCWSAARFTVAHWHPVSSTRCAGSGLGCPAAPRPRIASSSRISSPSPSSRRHRPGASAASSVCSGASVSTSTTPLLLARLTRRLCELALFFDVHAHDSRHVSRRRLPASVTIPRARATAAELQFLRKVNRGGDIEAAKLAAAFRTAD
jgi:4-amino-4-deoxy-L-arabinose transferase-like glycosyltransferase